MKVEDTETGDYARYVGPPSDRDVGVLFEMVNRGTRNVSLDLKSDEGTEAFYRLVEALDERADRRRIARVAGLEAEIDDLETPDQSDVLDQHREVNQLEFELERTKRERDEIEDEIASIEERLDEREGSSVVAKRSPTS